MKKALEGLFILVLIAFIFIGVMIFVVADENIILEANVKGSDNYLGFILDKNFIFFGNISKGQEKREKLCVNNTGTEDILVTPYLQEGYKGKIFDNLYLKTYGTSDLTLKPIGQYNVTIDGGKSKCFWFSLNLSDYPYPIYGDMPGHRVNVTIKVVPI